MLAFLASDPSIEAWSMRILVGLAAFFALVIVLVIGLALRDSNLLPPATSSEPLPLPELLRRLEKDIDERILGEAYQELLHQGSAGPESYVALPDLCAIAARAAPARRCDVLLLAGAIAVASERVRVAPEVEAACTTALRGALPLLLAEIGAGPDATTIVYLLQTAAGIAGHGKLGRAVEGFADRELQLTCPACDAQLFVWPRDPAALVVFADDPALVRPEPEGIPVAHDEALPRAALLPDQTPPELEVHPWLVQLALRGGHPSLAGLLWSLRGTATCPRCRQGFALLPALLAQA